MDPTNGYTAIHRTALASLPLDKLDRGYFFESDMLFRLYTLRAVVLDVPMRARYGDESSSLRVGPILRQFPPKYVGRTLKRVFYAYLLRDFNAGSLQLALGAIALLGGSAYGNRSLGKFGAPGHSRTPGEVMLAALPVLIGVELLIGALTSMCRRAAQSRSRATPSGMQPMRRAFWRRAVDAARASQRRHLAHGRHAANDRHDVVVDAPQRRGPAPAELRVGSLPSLAAHSAPRASVVRARVLRCRRPSRRAASG